MPSKIVFLFIILGMILLILGLSFGLKAIKPIQMNLIAGLIIMIGTGFGLFGKQLQDSRSSSPRCVSLAVR